MALAVTARALVAVIACLAAGAATAAAWQGDQSSGTLQFIATQAGAKFTGGFKAFSVRIDFDPAKPAGGSLDVTVALQSTDTADAERDGIIKGTDFFWVDRHPQAEFHAAQFKRDGARWRADGDLTLRGVKHPVAVRFALDSGRQQLTMTGDASLSRLDFGVGQGEWTSTEWIGKDVEIRFDLRLKPAAAAARP